MEEFSESIPVEYNESIMMLLEHNEIIKKMEQENGDEDFLYSGLSKLKQQIQDGITDGKIIKELETVVLEIDNIQKEIQIKKLQYQQYKFRKEEEELMEGWHLVDGEQLELETSGYMASLKDSYARSCRSFNLMRKPVRPLFVVMQWMLKIYSGGYYCLVPLVLKILAA